MREMANYCFPVRSIIPSRHGPAVPVTQVGLGIGMREQLFSSVRSSTVLARCSKGKDDHTTASVQPFTQPLWLSSSSRVDGNSTISQNLAASEALFLVQLNTSQDHGSGLSDPGAGIMISLIGENGSALLQRLPSSGATGPVASTGSSARPFFQTGSQDLIKLYGSHLGRLEAVWVAPEAGTWRVEQVIVAEIPCTESNLETISKLEEAGLSSLLDGLGNETLTGLLHLFWENQELVGDKCDLSAVELKPYAVHHFHDGASLKAHWIHGERVVDPELRKAGMEEYRALKTSLLTTSGLLVALGTLFLATLDSQQVAESFAVGGAGGFFYLLLLHYAVDQIPGPDFVSVVEHEGRDISTGPSEAPRSPIFGLPMHSLQLVLAPLSRTALVAIFTLVLARSVLGKAVFPHELLAGVAGFLVSVKIAVLLASGMVREQKPSKR